MRAGHRKFRVVIIGAGSAGLSAFRRAEKHGGDVLMVERGALGTTCARSGCMPSKAFLHIARDFHHRHRFEGEGIRGSQHMTCDIPAVLKRVRDLRDHFANGMVETTRELVGDRLVHGDARLLDAHHVELKDEVVEAESIIIATGADPIVPNEWRVFSDRILTTQNLFEQRDLPPRLAVVGLGAAGLELGQALARLGIAVSGFSHGEFVGGLRASNVNRALLHALKQEFPIHLGATVKVKQQGNGLLVRAGEIRVEVDGLLLTMGSKPNLDGLGLESLDIDLDENGIPAFDPRTGQVGNLSVYIAGDVNGERAVLHEALDEGFLAGENALRDKPSCGTRRTPFRMVFCEPEVVVVGQGAGDLENRSVATGSVDFGDQGRAMIEHCNQGYLELYADPKTGRLLGAEAAVPAGEYFGHLLALAIQQGLTIYDLLKMPFYHPTLIEALRTALHDAARKCASGQNTEGIPLHDCNLEGPLR